jgi:glycosyltransferase involved in cell wall biosynthesis
MLEALAWLKVNSSTPFRLRIIGPTLTRDDAAYAAELAEIVRHRNLTDRVSFEGPRPMQELPEIYGSAFLHLNLSATGSMDKAILESLACGCQTLTSNESVFPLFTDFPDLIVRDPTPAALGAQICLAYDRRHATSSDRLRALVTGRHDLDSYTGRIASILTELAGKAAA